MTVDGTHSAHSLKSDVIGQPLTNEKSDQLGAAQFSDPASFRAALAKMTGRVGDTQIGGNDLARLLQQDLKIVQPPQEVAMGQSRAANQFVKFEANESQTEQTERAADKTSNRISSEKHVMQHLSTGDKFYRGAKQELLILPGDGGTVRVNSDGTLEIDTTNPMKIGVNKDGSITLTDSTGGKITVKDGHITKISRDGKESSAEERKLEGFIARDPAAPAEQKTKPSEKPPAQPKMIEKPLPEQPKMIEKPLSEPGKDAGKELPPEARKKFEQLRTAADSGNLDDIMKAMRSLSNDPEAEKIIKAFVDADHQRGHWGTKYTIDTSTTPSNLHLHLNSGDGRYSLDFSSNPDGRPAATRNEIIWKKLPDGRISPDWSVKSTDVDVETAWRNLHQNRTTR